MSKLLTAVVIALLALGPVAAAGSTAQSAIQKKKNRQICKPVQETGSRLGNIRACMTARQWEEYYDRGDWERSGEVAAQELPVAGGLSPRR